MREYATISESSKILNLSPDTIRRWSKKGLIKSQRDKRNYRVFLIEELERVKKKYISKASDKSRYRILQHSSNHRINAIELFAGAGGLALGLKNAGVESKLLIEIDKYACETLSKNNQSWNVIRGDIKNICLKEYSGKVDVVTGGFPCQAFSYAGKSFGFEDIRGTLFFEFARCVKESMPKIVIGENVKGLLRHDNGRTLRAMVSILEDLGYRIKYKILRSQFLDVPQKRERLIVFGIRDDLKLKHIFPKEKNYTISLGETFRGCPKSIGSKYSEKKYKILKKIPQGGCWRDLPNNLQKEYMGKSYFLTGGKTGMARRLSLAEPSLTLTCSPAQKQTERCHPIETRPLSVREYARIQTFPDSWEFFGGITAQYKQIGNAVPVNLGYYIGRCVKASLYPEEFDPEIMDIESINSGSAQLDLFESLVE